MNAPADQQAKQTTTKHPGNSSHFEGSLLIQLARPTSNMPIDSRSLEHLHSPMRKAIHLLRARTYPPST
jgi:hypothetical protein